MKEKNNIDDLFRNNITGYKIEPSDQVWQNVESGFFGKKRIAFYRWYVFGAATLLFLLTAGGIWFFNMDDVNEGLPINEIIAPSTDELKISDETLKDDNITILETGTGNLIELIEKAAPDEESQNQNQIVELPLNERITDSNVELNTIDETLKNDNTFVIETGSENSSDLIEKFAPVELSQYPDQIIELSPDERITDDHKLEITSFKTIQQSITKSEFYSIESNPLGNTNYRLPLSKSIMSLEPRTIGIDYSTNVNMIDPEEVKGMTQYLEKERKSHFYTGASFTAGMVYYPSTKDQFTWSTDLTFGLTTGKFYFETGVSYQDMKERGIYAIELKSYDSIGYFNEVESFEINPQNPDEIIYNTKEVTVYDSLNHYTHTTPYFKYKYINIPLSIGFKFFNKQKFTASVSTGVSLSMLIESDIPDTEYYDPEFTLVRIRNMTPLRVDWNMIWMMSIRLNYKLYKSLSISAEPVFTKYLNSIYDTKKGYSNIKPYTMNLRVGLYYGF